MRIWSGLFARLPSSPLRVADKGLDWQWVEGQGSYATDADCPGARRFAFVAGAAPAYAPCAPAWPDGAPAEDGEQAQGEGFWQRLFGRRPAATEQPAQAPAPPAP